MARSILPGHASGTIVATYEGLSFWGGLDAATGKVIDAHHPLHQQGLAGKIVMMPTTRGSCTGSGVFLELALNGHAPAALIFREHEDVVTLGAMIARRMFDRPVPIIQLDADEYDAVAKADKATITDEVLTTGELTFQLLPMSECSLDLSPQDQAMLDGDSGEPCRIAMQIICAMAALQGASRLIDVTQVHIDGCIYASPANLTFAQVMVDMGAKVRVPTTMNAISVDHGNWRAQGVPQDFGIPASRLADAYVDMGARASFTCAPYLLDTAPAAGEMIAWAESNAVIYANSVLAARTVKHPDFLDLFIALTGRAPLSGVYLEQNRAACRIIQVSPPAVHDDALWPMLGYLAGQMSPDRIPLLKGLDDLAPSDDDLKALCAAFGTTSAAPMLHVAGITPEASNIAADADTVFVDNRDLLRVWQQLNPGPQTIQLVAFGSPHFSLTECRALAQLLAGKQVSSDISAIVTLGRDTLTAAKVEGLIVQLQTAGVQIVQDLCWCSISEPVFPPKAQTLMTNSGKYAHYAPGLSGRAVRFGSLADCAKAAQTGLAAELPDWLNVGG